MKSMLKFLLRFLSLLTISILVSSCRIDMSKENVPPPLAYRPPQLNSASSEDDPFASLENLENQKTIEYLKSEKEYADVSLKSLSSFQLRLYNEMRARQDVPSLLAPVRVDQYEYFARFEPGLAYPLYLRKSLGLPQEETVLDPNSVILNIKHNEQTELGILRISPNHKMIAFTIDPYGDGREQLLIRDLKNNSITNIKSERVNGAEWTGDNLSIVYTVRKQLRAYRVYRHVLGSKDPDVLLFEENDPRAHIFLTKSKDRNYIIISSNTPNTSDVYLLAAATKDSNMVQVQPKRSGVIYSVEPHEKQLFILTNADAPNFKVLSRKLDDSRNSAEQLIVSPSQDRSLTHFELFQKFMVVYERLDRADKIRVYDLRANTSYLLTFPEEIYSIKPASHLNFDSDSFRYLYSSPTTPNSVYEHSTTKKESTLVHRDEISDYDPRNYQVERLTVKSNDKTEIPLTLLYRKDIKQNGKNPTLLVGYGAYGIPLSISFSAERITLLKRGVVYAMCHARGGGEKGAHWHSEGKLLNKKNSINDFISCAKFLRDKGYSAPDLLFAYGRSAGALLVASAMISEPTIFKAVLLDSPFLDVLGVLEDSKDSLAKREYNEWGNPRIKKQRDYIKSYSPYDILRKQGYPNILVTSGIGDQVTSLGQVIKWIAKLRSLKTDKNLLILRTILTNSHEGPRSQIEHLNEEALRFSYILALAGISR